MRSLVPVSMFTSAERRKVSLKKAICDVFACFSPRMNVLLLVFHRELPLICLLSVTRITEIPEYYRNTGIPVKNIGIPVKDTY